MIPDDFRDALRGAGLSPPDVVEPGRFHRFPGVGKRNGNRAAWCKLFPDGVGGIYGDHSTGLSETWQAQRTRPQSFAEREAFLRHVAEARAEAEKARQDAQEEAATRAADLWKAASPAPADHPYLVVKGVQPHGLRVDCDTVLVPMRDADGELWGLQRINPAGEKRFLSGQRKTGCYFAIGRPTGRLIVAEGYATAASIHEATGDAVAVAFDAGNLEAVGRELRAKYPDLAIVFAADDDVATEGNPGITKATAAARAVGGLLAVPDFGPHRPVGATDFNDLARHSGLEAVRTTLEHARPPQAVQPPPSQQNAPRTDLGRVELRCASDIPAEPVKWYWDGWLAGGKLHILAGPPGAGKTTLCMGIAATVTIGGRWPDGKRATQGSVAIWSGEDAPSDTLVPRLIANGADLSRCHFVGPVVDGDQRWPFDPAKDVSLLAAELARIPDLRLLIVDPVVSAVSGDAHKSNDVRRGLQPLADLAEQLGVSILGISHFSKGTANKDPVERVTGSIAFGAAARLVLGAVKRDDDKGGGRILVRAKSNIGPDSGGFVYDLELVDLPGGIQTTRVVWKEALDGNARALLASAENTDDAETRSDLSAAKSFLRSMLEDGPVASKIIRRDAEDAGHSWATIRRAQTELGVDARKVGMKEGWVWELLPKMLKNPEDAHGLKVGTFGEDAHVRELAHEPAHLSSVSTFGGNEHLRGDEEIF